MDDEVIGDFDVTARQLVLEETREGDSVELPFIVSSVTQETKLVDALGNPL